MLESGLRLGFVKELGLGLESGLGLELGLVLEFVKESGLGLAKLLAQLSLLHRYSKLIWFPS